MQLTFDSDVEEFRAEFAAFLDEYLPPETETQERPRSVSHMPQWARDWQRLLFDNGWLLPAQPPEFGGRNATVLQQFVHLDELCRRRIYHSLNPQGVNIIAASLISFGFTIHKFFEYRVQQGAIPNDRLLGPAAFGGIMIATGLLALMLASYDHRRSLQALRASYGPIPHSVAATIGIIMATLGLLALVAVMFGL